MPNKIKIFNLTDKKKKELSEFWVNGKNPDNLIDWENPLVKIKQLDNLSKVKGFD